MSPTNDIERLLENPRFGKHDYPELFRLLRESDLIFLVANKNNSRGVAAWTDLTELPPFVTWGNVRIGLQIPIFSSYEAARRACREVGAWNQFAFRQLKGQQLFEMLSRQEESFVINPAVSEYQMVFDNSHAKQLADGSIMQTTMNKSEEGTLQLLSPYEYPDHMVSELLQFFRKTPTVLAAWLFYDTGFKEDGKDICYVYVLDVAGDRKQIEKDFQIIADMTCPKRAHWGIRVMRPHDATDASIPKTFPPFYNVKGYKALGTGN